MLPSDKKQFSVGSLLRCCQLATEDRAKSPDLWGKKYDLKHKTPVLWLVSKSYPA